MKWRGFLCWLLWWQKPDLGQSPWKSEQVWTFLLLKRKQCAEAAGLESMQVVQVPPTMMRHLHAFWRSFQRNMVSPGCGTTLRRAGAHAEVCGCPDNHKILGLVKRIEVSQTMIQRVVKGKNRSDPASWQGASSRMALKLRCNKTALVWIKTTYVRDMFLCTHPFQLYFLELISWQHELGSSWRIVLHCQ